MTVRVETFAGAAMTPYFADLARLRTLVFRGWPYLYDGKPETDGAYNHYARSPHAAMVMAFDGDVAVGCSTCQPLSDEDANITAPFSQQRLAAERYFYFGESVLLPQYRGRGVGVAFFAERETHARRVSDAEFACFCAVRRAPDDPRRPPDTRSLDAFWRKRGYAPLPGVACTMRWREIGGQDKSLNTLDFWAKALR